MIAHTLLDPEGGGTLEVEITPLRYAIYVNADGYGCEGSAEYSPIVIEFYNKELRVLVWERFEDDEPVILALRPKEE